MNQKEACAEVKTMLEEMQKISPKLKDLVDSEGNLEEIKKTKEVLQDILHKHRVLRRNLKEWERRSKKIQRIDKIAEKLKKEGDDADLSVDELHALYKQEMRGFDSSSPFAFSYYAHSETRGLREKRQIEGKTKEDYARIYGCKPEQVTSEEDDVFEKNSNIVVFIGDIDFTKKELPKTLKHVSGNLQSDSKNAKLPKNLEYVGGHFTLKELQEIPKEGLDLQHVTMGGVLNLSSLESAEGLKLPKKTQSLYLSSLESVKGLVLPETLAGDLSLISLTSAKGLVLPEAIGGRLKLRSLTSAEGLVLPKTVGGDLYLRSLESAKGLVLPETLGGDLWLTSLTSAEGLESLDYTGVRGIVWPPKAFSDKDKEKVEEIKVEQEKKGINVTFF